MRTGGVGQTALNDTGQRRDATGLLYYHARYYDPALGRFISPDRIVPGAGSLTLAPHDAAAREAWPQRGGVPATPQELNRYAYARNNPLRWTDPTGHWIESALDIAFIIADIAEIAHDPSNGWAWASLAADVVGLALPAVTGGGMAIRAVAHGDDLVQVYRGTSKVTELGILDQTGHVLSEAAQQAFMETGDIAKAYEQSRSAHTAALQAFGGDEKALVEAHSRMGHELTRVTGQPRTMISVTTDPHIAQYFAGPSGRVLAGHIPRSELVKQTLPGAGESEWLIRHGTTRLR